VFLSGATRYGGIHLETSTELLGGARRALSVLRLRGPLANDPTAKILHSLLAGLLCWIVFNIVLISPFYAVHETGSLGISLFAGLLFATAIVLLNRGQLRTASLLYLFGVWLPATVTIVWNGGIHGVTMVFYIALPISAAWLLGYWPALITAGVCLGSALAMALVEQIGVHLPNYTPGTPIATWTTILAAMIVAAVPVARVLQILKEALTQSELAKEALRESEERFRNMADTAPVMIWVSGLDKLCNFFNRSWLEFTGRTLEQESGDGWAEGVHPSDLDRCISTYSASFDARRTFQMEYRLRRNDGEYRWILDEGAPRFRPGGVFSGYVGSCVDITEIKRGQEEAIANQKLESVSQLARGIAHDFNNLLGGILATAEFALAEHESSLDREELLTIRTAAVRGGEIVSQLMTYAGEESEALGPVDFSLLVEEMLQLLKASISKQAILETELAGGLPAVQANAAQIRQVVMNLVTNASEAIGARGGVIRVTTAPVMVEADAPAVGAANLLPGDYVKLEISDTGNGMTPEIQARIFDPFFTTKPTGHGLGLAAVQGIVRGHDGAINVVSSLGQGTRFEVLLPCASRQVHLTADTGVGFG
jgi:PAS domain S-box-containing protein